MLSKAPEKIGWKRVFNPQSLNIDNDAYIVSLIFEGKDINYVKQWALDNGMYIDITSKDTIGLRYKHGNNISWVQYFGPDSHVKTRRTPEPELIFCVKLPAKTYVKVGFDGVLHLAHASIAYLKETCLDLFWNKSFERTAAIIGHTPTINEAAKTTFKK